MGIAALVAKGPLRLGAKGDAVVALQSTLRSAGHELVTDGDFGAFTETAVRRFQTAHDLLADGVVGPITARALDQYSDVDGLDRDIDLPQPEPTNIPALWPRQSAVLSFYGAVGQHQTTLILPYAMRLAWDTTKIVTRFSVHEKVHDSARRCFEKVADAYDEAKRVEIGIDLFGGCLNVRKMRGGSSYSMHSWGIAIDFDPERNQLKWGRDMARLAQSDCDTFWRIWEEEGWVSLGRVRNFDWMHIQAARL